MPEGSGLSIYGHGTCHDVSKTQYDFKKQIEINLLLVLLYGFGATRVVAFSRSKFSTMLTSAFDIHGTARNKTNHNYEVYGSNLIKVLAIRLENNICKIFAVSTGLQRSPAHAFVCFHGQSQRGGPPDGELCGDNISSKQKRSSTFRHVSVAG
jgi:hypothetical protein